MTEKTENAIDEITRILDEIFDANRWTHIICTDCHKGEMLPTLCGKVCRVISIIPHGKAAPTELCPLCKGIELEKNQRRIRDVCTIGFCCKDKRK